MSSQSSGSTGGLVGQHLGKYELLALLALGGTAEIYLARIAGVAGFEKHVVVKCLHDHLADDGEFVRMFRDEARLGANLTHSNIVQTLELGEHQGRYYMVMEYLAGMSMSVISRKAAERIQGGVLPVELSLGLMMQACAGLHYAHCRKDSSGRPMNIVHRDVSPQNLVVTFDGNLKVVDFGIAKAAVRETQTQSGTIKGKFAYMSPEQCVAGDMDKRTDVFALGIIIHEFLTGRRLFKRDSAYDTYHAILECKVTPPSHINRSLDGELDSIVMKALAYEAKNRYSSAEELGDALQGYLHRRGVVVNAATITRFFDQYFDQEIREHGERMRALMQGRQTELNNWGDEDDIMSDPASGHGNHSQERSEVLDPSMLEEIVEDEDGSTQIENNPLERIRDMALQQAARASGQADPSATERANAEKKTVAISAQSGIAEVGAALLGSNPVMGGAAGAKTLVPGDLYSGGPGMGGPGADDDDDDVDEDAATLIADQSLNVDKLLADAKAQFQQQQAANPGGSSASGPAPGPYGSGPTPGPYGSGPTPGPLGSGPTPGPGSGPTPGPQSGPMPGPQGGPGWRQPGGQPGPGGYGQPGSGYGQPHGQPGYPQQQSPYGTSTARGPGATAATQEGHPTWLLAVIFFVCVGVGLGVTLLIASLL